MGNLKGNKHFVLFPAQFFVGLIVQSLFLLHFLVPSSPSFASSSSNTQLKQEIDRNSDESPLFREKRDEQGSFTVINLDNLSRLAHGVKCSGMRLLDEKTIEIDKLFYDGKGPAARFMVGNSPDYKKEYVKLGGTIIPDETGSCEVLKRYDGKDVKLVLPGNMTWSDVNYFAVFCIAYNHNFGSVHIPPINRTAGGWEEHLSHPETCSSAARIGGGGLFRGLMKLFGH